MGIRLAARARSSIRRREHFLVVDGFGRGSLDASLWARPAWVLPGDMPTVVAGRLRTPATPGYACVVSVSALDLRGRDFSVELVSTPSLIEGTETYMGFNLDPSGADSGPYVQWAMIGDAGGRLQAMHGNGTYLYLTEIAFSPVAHRFLRLREEAGTVFYEVSPDGVVWSTVTSLVHPYPPGPALARVFVGSGYYGGVPAVAFADWDNIRIGSPALSV